MVAATFEGNSSLHGVTSHALKQDNKTCMLKRSIPPFKSDSEMHEPRQLPDLDIFKLDKKKTALTVLKNFKTCPRSFTFLLFLLYVF